jgi:hypothetical protein
MARLLLAATLACACAHHRSYGERKVVPQNETVALETQVAESLRCPEDQIESHQLTLLTREVSACGQKRVYAWDAMREKWVLASVEKR